jgi:hypothetical protein
MNHPAMPHHHPSLLMTQSVDSFLSVLHAIVSNESLDSAIHWLPCGTKFIVSDRKEFVRLVLSQNFFGHECDQIHKLYTTIKALELHEDSKW